MPRKPQQFSAPEDDFPEEPFSGAAVADLKDLAKRGKAAAAQRKRYATKLAKLLEVDPEAESAQRMKDFEECAAAAKKRMEALTASHTKLLRGRTPLMQQIQNMMSRKAS